MKEKLLASALAIGMIFSMSTAISASSTGPGMAACGSPPHIVKCYF